MKLFPYTSTLAAMVGVSLASAAHATVVFDASPMNTTVTTNNGSPTGLAGTPGALTLTGATNGFNSTGIASTSDINTLNGTNLVATDTVTIRLTVDSITGGPIRANGINFGIRDAASFVGVNALGIGNNLIGLEAGNNGSDILSFVDSNAVVDTGFSATDAEILNGFSLTLTADVNGWEYTLESVGATSPLTVGGTYSGTEFVDTFGGGHFFYTAQKFNNADPLVSTISEASIHVTSIPEPSAFALLGLGSLGLLLRRRRA